MRGKPCSHPSVKLASQCHVVGSSRTIHCSSHQLPNIRSGNRSPRNTTGVQQCDAQDAGYVQVTPLLGTLAPLVVLPVGHSPLEGWRFLPESTSAAPYYQSQTFEGLYEWQFHTLAYAQKEWSHVTPWNVATSAILQPGATRTYGVQFRLAPSIRGIENTGAEC